MLNQRIQLVAEQPLLYLIVLEVMYSQQAQLLKVQLRLL